MPLCSGIMSSWGWKSSTGLSLPTLLLSLSSAPTSGSSPYKNGTTISKSSTPSQQTSEFKSRIRSRFVFIVAFVVPLTSSFSIQFQCCGYFLPNDTVEFSGSFCTNQTFVNTLVDPTGADPDLFRCVKPITAFTDPTLNNIFTCVLILHFRFVLSLMNDVNRTVSYISDETPLLSSHLFGDFRCMVSWRSSSSCFWPPFV